MPIFSLAAVLVLLLILIVVLVLILILIVVLILILVLVIHRNFLRICTCGCAAELAFPKFQALSLARKMRLAKSPLVMATAMPPAVAFKPPMKMPRNPFSLIASFTPFDKL